MTGINRRNVSSKMVDFTSKREESDSHENQREGVD